MGTFDPNGASDEEATWTISSEDAARILTPNEGWNAPALSTAQADALLALIRPPLAGESQARFRLFASRIFAIAVERYSAFRHAVPRKVLRRAAEEASKSLREIDRLCAAEIPPPIVGLVEDALDRQTPPKDRKGLTAVEWLAGLSGEARREARLQALSKVAVEIKRGPSNVIDRLMVRAMVGLVYDLVGEIPRRTFRHAGKEGGPNGEHYWFLELAAAMARFVNAALPDGLKRPSANTLTGIVKEELEAAKEQNPARSAI